MDSAPSRDPPDATASAAARPRHRREVVARVLAGGEAGKLLLRIGRVTVEARSTLELPPGATLRLAVVHATADRVLLSLGGAESESADGLPPGAPETTGLADVYA